VSVEEDVNRADIGDPIGWNQQITSTHTVLPNHECLNLLEVGIDDDVCYGADVAIEAIDSHVQWEVVPEYLSPGGLCLLGPLGLLLLAGLAGQLGSAKIPGTVGRAIRLRIKVWLAVQLLDSQA
jgi:hypothetical protein